MCHSCSTKMQFSAELVGLQLHTTISVFREMSRTKKPNSLLMKTVSIDGTPHRGFIQDFLLGRG